MRRHSRSRRTRPRLRPGSLRRRALPVDSTPAPSAIRPPRPRSSRRRPRRSPTPLPTVAPPVAATPEGRARSAPSRAGAPGGSREGAAPCSTPATPPVAIEPLRHSSAQENLCARDRGSGDRAIPRTLDQCLRTARCNSEANGLRSSCSTRPQSRFGKTAKSSRAATPTCDWNRIVAGARMPRRLTTALNRSPDEARRPGQLLPKVGMISLGCAKNLVDAEIMLGSVLEHGMQITAQRGGGGRAGRQHLRLHRFGQRRIDRRDPRCASTAWTRDEARARN